MKKFVAGMVCCGIIAAGIISSPRLTEESVNVKVNRSFIKDNKYLVYTDHETYEFDDSWAYLKFMPDEDWSKIKQGSCYNLKAIGFRIRVPLTGINIYKNVVDSSEIKCDNVTTD